jgi:hypothetical protein
MQFINRLDRRDVSLLKEISIMSNKRKMLKFWRRKKPNRKHDITLLMPGHLPKGKRFETRQDTYEERERSEALLGSTVEATILANCRNGPACNNTFCPICARRFRRWFIGELLRITETETRRIRVLTVLLEAADRKAISDLNFRRHGHILWKRLQRAGLGGAVAIWGVEMAYRAREKKWILHVNLVIIGGRKASIKEFQESFARSDMDRPVVTVGLNNRAEQLSYVLKFTTYHRPFTQRGPARSRAVPLNGPDHRALVEWMHQYQFTDFLFLYKARRKGSVISVINVAGPPGKVQG